MVQALWSTFYSRMNEAHWAAAAAISLQTMTGDSPIMSGSDWYRATHQCHSESFWWDCRLHHFCSPNMRASGIYLLLSRTPWQLSSQTCANIQDYRKSLSKLCCLWLAACLQIKSKSSRPWHPQRIPEAADPSGKKSMNIVEAWRYSRAKQMSHSRETSGSDSEFSS